MQSYKEWGINCLHHFNGMFAIILYDKSLNKAYIARDRFGVKPIYYYIDKNRIKISSEILPILETENIKFIDDTTKQLVAPFQRLLPTIVADNVVTGITQTISPFTFKSLFMIAQRSADKFDYTLPFYFDNIDNTESCQAFCKYGNDKFLVIYESNGIKKVAILKPNFI